MYNGYTVAIGNRHTFICYAGIILGIASYVVGKRNRIILE